MSEEKTDEKPTAHQLCGWCGSGHHKRCEERNGWVPFAFGVHKGNQCRCHDVGHTVNLRAAKTVKETPPARKRPRRKS